MQKNPNKVKEIISEKNKYRKALTTIKERISEGSLGIHRGQDELIYLLDTVGIYLKHE